MCTALPGTPRPGGGGGLGVGVGVIIILGVISLGGLGSVVLLGVRPLVVGLVVVAQVLLVLEHLVAVLALEGTVQCSVVLYYSVQYSTVPGRCRCPCASARVSRGGRWSRR